VADAILRLPLIRQVCSPGLGLPLGLYRVWVCSPGLGQPPGLYRVWVCLWIGMFPVSSNGSLTAL
jgi:hypothetical protein